MPPKPKLGQNFLIDDQGALRIVSALGDLSGRTVVEIGPGHGAITERLAERAGCLVGIELDRNLAADLRKRFDTGRVTVLEQDVLEFDFAAGARRADQQLRVVGNLPFYITSPILLKLARSHAALDLAVLMVQREVADRVTALPGSRDYGLLSVTVQMYGEVEHLFTLPPTAFFPPPKVHSSVFRWRFRPRFAELGVSEADFLPFVRQAFAQKRKTLVNNLRAAGISTGIAEAALAETGIDPKARAEALPLERLAALWRDLQSKTVA